MNQFLPPIRTIRLLNPRVCHQKVSFIYIFIKYFDFKINISVIHRNYSCPAVPLAHFLLEGRRLYIIADVDCLTRVNQGESPEIRHAGCDTETAADKTTADIVARLFELAATGFKTEEELLLNGTKLE